MTKFVNLDRAVTGSSQDHLEALGLEPVPEEQETLI